MFFFLNLRFLFFLWGGFFSLLSGIEPIQTNNIEIISNLNNSLNSTKSGGYRAIVNYNDGFIAAGVDGRIDWISISGEITKSEKFPEDSFNCMLSVNQSIIIAGNRGTFMMSSGGQTFRKVDSGTNQNINALAFFNEILIAGTDEGELLLGDFEGFYQIIDLDLKGKIVSLSANSSYCYGVTDKGEIVHSTDGINWDVFDFNQVYSGYYKPCKFTRILLTSNRIAVAGINDDGSPAFYFSTRGNVWSERILYYTDDKDVKGYLTESPNDIFYDEIENQFILACTNGVLVVLPSCTQCNLLTKISENDLLGISGLDNSLLIVGDDYFLKKIYIR